MFMDLHKSEEYFSRVRGGDIDAFIEILEIERAVMFDYLMRMTGQSGRAKDTLDEVGRTLRTRLSEYHSLPALRVGIYRKAREANRDIWYADTRQLENSGLSGFSDHDYEASVEALQLLDQSLNKLPGIAREVVLLRYRHVFDEHEISQIVGTSRDEIVGHLKAGFLQLKNLGFADDTDFALLLGEVPGHPVPERSAYSTMALSAMMSELRRSHRRPMSDTRWFFLAIVLGVVAVLVVLMLMGSPIFPWRR